MALVPDEELRKAVKLLREVSTWMDLPVELRSLSLTVANALDTYCTSEPVVTRLEE